MGCGFSLQSVGRGTFIVSRVDDQDTTIIVTEEEDKLNDNTDNRHYVGKTAKKK